MFELFLCSHVLALTKASQKASSPSCGEMMQQTPAED